MRQVKAILELRYSQLPTVYDYKRKILESLTAKPQKTTKALVEGIDLRISENKARIIVESNRIVVNIEQTNLAKAQDFFMTIYDRADKFLHFSHIDQIGYRSLYVDDQTQPFNRLVDKYKLAFYKDSPLVIEANDVGIPLTYKTDDTRINFMSGPMLKEQLTGLLEYSIDGLDRVYFIDIDIIKNDIDISRRVLKNYFAEIKDKQKELITKWENSMEAKNE